MSEAEKTPILVVPGWQDSSESHWQTCWQVEGNWGRVEQDDWEHPRKPEWVKALVDAAQSQSAPPVLVTHSLGGTTLAHAVAENPDLQVRAAFIVATPDVEQADFPQEIQGFSPSPLVRFPFPSLLIASSSDPFSTLERTKALADAWGGEFINVGPRDHIGENANLGDWPEGKAIFLEFLSSLQPK